MLAAPQLCWAGFIWEMMSLWISKRVGTTTDGISQKKDVFLRKKKHPTDQSEEAIGSLDPGYILRLYSHLCDIPGSSACPSLSLGCPIRMPHTSSWSFPYLLPSHQVMRHNGPELNMWLRRGVGVGGGKGVMRNFVPLEKMFNLIKPKN